MWTRQFHSKLIECLRTLKRRQGITEFDIVILLRQLATLITAGIPIMKCLDIIRKSQTNTAIQLLLHLIRQEMLAGKDLSSCLRQHTRYFNAVTCQLIKIGEYSGNLENTINMIAIRMEKNLSFKKRVRQALFYPVIITIVALVVTLCMFIFVIPRFAELFSNAKIQLPMLTVWIFYLSDKLRQSAIFVIILTLFFSISLVFAGTAPLVKNKFKQMLLHIPFLYQCQQKMQLARLARILSMSFAAGLPVTDALSLTIQAEGSRDFTLQVMRLRSRINSGLQLHQAMEATTGFPNLMIQLTKVGDETGMLDQMLDKVADIFESDIDQVIGQLNQLLEPLIMLVLGVLIGGLVIGMYLPIFKLGSVL